MDDIKKAGREVETDVKKAVRGIDGESTSDKIANTGDEVRKNLGNAGDDIKSTVDKTADQMERRGASPLAPRSTAHATTTCRRARGRSRGAPAFCVPQPPATIRPAAHRRDRGRVPAGRRPVGQDERRPAGHHGLERRPQSSLRRGIEVGRRLVEHEDRGIADERTGDRQASALAAAQAYAVLADPRRVAVGQRVDERTQLRRLERRARPLVGQVGVGQREVVADRRVEQVHALRGHRQHRAHVVRGEPPDLPTADADLALGVRLEPQQELDQRRLAGTARPDDGEPAARGDREREVVDDGPGLVS